MDTKKIEFTLHSDFYPASEVRDFVAALCTQFGFEGQDVYQIKSAVDEAFINVVNHAYKGKKGKIKVRVEFDKGRFCISIKDWGRPLDARCVKKSSIAELVKKQKEGGLGMMMIERFMDRVKYIRRKKHNELVMAKGLRRQG